jgi:NitT/TauT family transport system substrate-binding protein
MPIDRPAITRSTFVAGVAASALSVAGPASAQSFAQIRVVTAPSAFGMLPLLAQDKGYFTRAGLDVAVTIGPGASSLPAVAGGEYEIGNSNVGVLAAASLRGFPITIIAEGGQYNSKTPQTALCVAVNSPIQTAKDLVGKKIGVNGLKQLAPAAISLWMEKSGVDPASVAKVEYIEVPLSLMPSLLEQGRVDAVEPFEPQLSEARAKMRVLTYPLNNVGSIFSTLCYMAKTEWVANNREAVRRFRSALEQTAVWANANPQPAGLIIAKYLKIPEASIATMAPAYYGTTLEASSLQPPVDTMAKYGYIPKRVDITTIMNR